MAEAPANKDIEDIDYLSVVDSDGGLDPSWPDAFPADPSWAHDWRSFGDGGATKLAEILRTDSSVKILYLEGRDIGDCGATQLARMLLTNRSLKMLRLNSNRIGNSGASELASMLLANRSLEELNFFGECAFEPCQRLDASIASPMADGIWHRVQTIRSATAAPTS